MPGVTTAYQNGIHSARPAANAGCILYACSTHSLIYRSDGSTWSTWMTIGSSTTTVASDAIWDAAGDLAVGTGADTAAKLGLTVPAANILNVLGVVNGETTPTWKAVHDGTAPVTQAAGDAAAAGTALTAAHRDHKHGMPGTAAFGILQLGSAKRSAGNVASSSGTFVDVTGLSVTITTGAHRCVIVVLGSINVSSSVAALDIDIDGSREGDTGGLQYYSGTNQSMCLVHVTGVLSAAAHTFKLQHLNLGGGTNTFYGTSGDNEARIFVIETGLTS